MKVVIALLVWTLTMSSTSRAQNATINTIVKKHRSYEQKLANFSADFTQSFTQAGQATVTTFTYRAYGGRCLIKVKGKGSAADVCYHSEIDGKPIVAIGEIGELQYASRDKTPMSIGAMPLDFGYWISGRPLAGLLEGGGFTISPVAEDATWGKAYLLQGNVTGLGRCSIWVSAEDFMVFKSEINDEGYVSSYVLKKTISQNGLRLPTEGSFTLQESDQKLANIAYAASAVSFGGVKPEEVDLLDRMAPGSKYLDKVEGKKYVVSPAGKLVQTMYSPSKKGSTAPNFFGAGLILLVTALTVTGVSVLCFRKSKAR